MLTLSLITQILALTTWPNILESINTYLWWKLSRINSLYPKMTMPRGLIYNMDHIGLVYLSVHLQTNSIMSKRRIIWMSRVMQELNFKYCYICICNTTPIYEYESAFTRFFTVCIFLIRRHIRVLYLITFNSVFIYSFHYYFNLQS